MVSRTRETLEIVREAIEAAGGSAVVAACDFADGDDVAALMQRIVEEEGRVDILVNNAGITRDGLILR